MAKEPMSCFVWVGDERVILRVIHRDGMTTVTPGKVSVSTLDKASRAAVLAGTMASERWLNV